MVVPSDRVIMQPAVPGTLGKSCPRGSCPEDWVWREEVGVTIGNGLGILEAMPPC